MLQDTDFYQLEELQKKDQGSGRRIASHLPGSFCHAPLR